MRNALILMLAILVGTLATVATAQDIEQPNPFAKTGLTYITEFEDRGEGEMTEYATLSGNPQDLTAFVHRWADAQWGDPSWRTTKQGQAMRNIVIAAANSAYIKGTIQFSLGPDVSRRSFFTALNAPSPNCQCPRDANGDCPCTAAGGECKCVAPEPLPLPPGVREVPAANKPKVTRKKSDLLTMLRPMPECLTCKKLRGCN